MTECLDICSIYNTIYFNRKQNKLSKTIKTVFLNRLITMYQPSRIIKGDFHCKRYGLWYLHLIELNDNSTMQPQGVLCFDLLYFCLKHCFALTMLALSLWPSFFQHKHTVQTAVGSNFEYQFVESFTKGEEEIII